MNVGACLHARLSLVGILPRLSSSTHRDKYAELVAREFKLSELRSRLNGNLQFGP